jgi:hypothetical protein
LSTSISSVTMLLRALPIASKPSFVVCNQQLAVHAVGDGTRG